MDKIIGLFFFAIYFIKLTSVISADATLYALHFRLSKKSTDDLSNAEANQFILFLSKILTSFSIQFQGV